MLPSVFPLPNLKATSELASIVSLDLQRGDFIALEGDLGTGKTEFARALLRSLGVLGDVPSPTFTLVQSYETEHLTVSHFDLYRLRSADELIELGWDDALAETVCIVEWPDRASQYLPPERLTLRFSLNADGNRACTVEKSACWQSRL